MSKLRRFGEFHLEEGEDDSVVVFDGSITRDGDREVFQFSLSFESDNYGSPFATIKQTARGISFEFTDEKADLAIHRLTQMTKRLSAFFKQ